MQYHPSRHLRLLHLRRGLLASSSVAGSSLQAPSSLRVSRRCPTKTQESPSCCGPRRSGSRRSQCQSLQRAKAEIESEIEVSSKLHRELHRSCIEVACLISHREAIESCIEVARFRSGMDSTVGNVRKRWRRVCFWIMFDQCLDHDACLIGFHWLVM